jgi:hypothetical protein
MRTTQASCGRVLSDFEGLKVFNAEVREANPFQARFREYRRRKRIIVIRDGLARRARRHPMNRTANNRQARSAGLPLFYLLVSNQWLARAKTRKTQRRV